MSTGKPSVGKESAQSGVATSGSAGPTRVKSRRWIGIGRAWTFKAPLGAVHSSGAGVWHPGVLSAADTGSRRCRQQPFLRRFGAVAHTDIRRAGCVSWHGIAAPLSPATGDTAGSPGVSEVRLRLRRPALRQAIRLARRNRQPRLANDPLRARRVRRLHASYQRDGGLFLVRVVAGRRQGRPPGAAPSWPQGVARTQPME